MVLLISVFSVTALANQTLKKPKGLPDFKLTDQYGETFTADRLKGKWSMIFVGFTTCPDVCPYTLANLEAVRADMGFRLTPDKIPNIIFLAVDPERDEPLLKEYLYYYHPEYIGITGDRGEIDTLIRGLDAYYRLDKKTPDDKIYNVIHSAKVAVINPDAEIVAKIDPPFQAHRTGEFLMQLIRGIEE
jgi:protein SCO1/2